MMFRNIVRGIFGLSFGAALVFLWTPTTNVYAQGGGSCSSLRDCADRMVELVSGLGKDVEKLTKQVANESENISGLDSRIRSLEGMRSVVVYQCPIGTEGWHPGGAWGYYGCQGQITTNSSCYNVEAPHRQNRACTEIGSMILK